MSCLGFAHTHSAKCGPTPGSMTRYAELIHDDFFVVGTFRIPFVSSQLFQVRGGSAVSAIRVAAPAVARLGWPS